MAGNKYVAFINNVLTRVAAIQISAGSEDAGKIPAVNANGVLDTTLVNSKTTSAGAGDVGKIPKADSSGKLDKSWMPPGITADTREIPTSENLSAGNLVNIFNDSGTSKVRKTDATTAGKDVWGFVLESYTHPTTATVYFEGNNTAVTGLTPGKQYLSTTPGQCSVDAPTGDGNVVQIVGFATDATSMNFERGDIVIL
jgi:hypothetical protein